MANITLHEGRPTDKRSARENSAYDYLDKLHIKYRRADHPAADTMEACEIRLLTYQFLAKYLNPPHPFRNIKDLRKAGYKYY